MFSRTRHKPGGGQLTDLRFIERWLEREIELFQCFDEGKARQAGFHRHVPFRAGAHFAFEDMLQERHIAPMVASGFFRQPVEVITHPAQFEALQDGLQMQIAVITHGRFSINWS